MPATVKADEKTTRRRAQHIDRYVGKRLRERRLRLGLTQQQMAELIGVTYQQAYKYERGINRISSGRLYSIAQALGVETSYFFKGISNKSDALRLTSKERLLLELGRNFLRITDWRQQEAVCSLVRALVGSEMGFEPERSTSPTRSRSVTAAL